MSLLHRWPVLRTSLIAAGLGIASVGICQLAFSRPHGLGGCFVVRASPWVRLCDWFQSGRRESLSLLFDQRERDRFVSTALSMIVLGVMLALSIRARRPPRFRLHVRTLMIVVAIVPFAFWGECKIWSMWERWDHCYEAAEHCTSLEETFRRPDPSDPPQYAELRQRGAETCRLAKEKYQQAMWRPWVDVEPFAISELSAQISKSCSNLPLGPQGGKDGEGKKDGTDR